MNEPRFRLFDEVNHKKFNDHPFIVIGYIYVWASQTFKYYIKDFSNDNAVFEVMLESDLSLVKSRTNEPNC